MQMVWNRGYWEVVDEIEVLICPDCGEANAELIAENIDVPTCDDWVGGNLYACLSCGHEFVTYEGFDDDGFDD